MPRVLAIAGLLCRRCEKLCKQNECSESAVGYRGAVTWRCSACDGVCDVIELKDRRGGYQPRKKVKSAE